MSAQTGAPKVTADTKVKRKSRRLRTRTAQITGSSRRARWPRLPKRQAPTGLRDVGPRRTQALTSRNRSRQGGPKRQPPPWERPSTEQGGAGRSRRTRSTANSERVTSRTCPENETNAPPANPVGAFVNRNPATTYSPRGSLPKYHRR